MRKGRHARRSTSAFHSWRITPSYSFGSWRSKKVAGLRSVAQGERVVAVRIGECLLPRCGRLTLRLRRRVPQAQPDATGALIQADDLSLHFVARLDHFARRGDVPVGQLRDVDQTFDPVFQLGEGTEVDHTRNRTRNDVVDGVAFIDGVPRIGQGLFEAEGDALPLRVDLEHHDLNLVALGEDVPGMIDAAPGHFGDMQQAFDRRRYRRRAEVDARRTTPGMIEPSFKVRKAFSLAFSYSSSRTTLRDRTTLFRCLSSSITRRRKVWPTYSSKFST